MKPKRSVNFSLVRFQLIDAILFEIQFAIQLSRWIEESIDRLIGMQMLKCWERDDEREIRPHYLFKKNFRFEKKLLFALSIMPITSFYFFLIH